MCRRIVRQIVGVVFSLYRCLFSCLIVLCMSVVVVIDVSMSLYDYMSDL